MEEVLKPNFRVVTETEFFTIEFGEYTYNTKNPKVIHKLYAFTFCPDESPSNREKNWSCIFIHENIEEVIKAKKIYENNYVESVFI